MRIAGATGRVTAEYIAVKLGQAGRLEGGIEYSVAGEIPGNGRGLVARVGCFA